MLLSQLRLKEGRAAKHSGGTVTIHYELMLDAMLEFLCGNQIHKKKGRACQSGSARAKQKGADVPDDVQRRSVLHLGKHHV